MAQYPVKQTSLEMCAVESDRKFELKIFQGIVAEPVNFEHRIQGGSCRIKMKNFSRRGINISVTALGIVDGKFWKNCKSILIFR